MIFVGSDEVVFLRQMIEMFGQDSTYISSQYISLIVKQSKNLVGCPKRCEPLPVICRGP